MSHKNYTQYSKFSGEEPMLVDSEPAVQVDPIVNENESAVIEHPIEGQTVIPEVAPEPIPEVEPNIDVVQPEPVIRKIGKIHGCKKLRVRKLPNPGSEIISELIEGVEVMIDGKSSTSTFYKICTEHGIEGYCMKDYIKILK